MKLPPAHQNVLIVFTILFLTTLSNFLALAQLSSARPVKNIVIVHGAWVDASSWSKVIPLLQAKGFHVVAVQNPLTSLGDDIAATRRVIALQDGPVLLVGHSYGGVVITEVGNDPKVIGLVYVAAFAPPDGGSINSMGKSYAPAPLGGELRPDAQGFLSVTPKGVAEDIAQEFSEKEQQVLTATQGQTASSVFSATITTAAWKAKQSWCVIASNDRAIPPELEKSEAVAIGATSITLPSGHLVMLTHPREVADFIERAAAKINGR